MKYSAPNKGAKEDGISSSQVAPFHTAQNESTTETEFSWTAFKSRIAVISSWFALCKIISQIFSWTATIFIARLLQPGDYGLMEMSTIISGYAMRFSELGLGAAIIQRADINRKELSSVFWFSFFISLCLAVSCFGIAELSSRIFYEPKIIPLTRAVGFLFILQGLQIVPLNILKRKLEFIKIGIVEIISVLISGIGMILLALNGAGAWTLIGGAIILGIAQTVLYLTQEKWVPEFHFSFQEIREYLRFGLIIVFQGTLFYGTEKSDKFFAARAWTTQILGYYSFALQLAQIPTEKITVMINQIAFPALSVLQNRMHEFRSFFLSTIRITASIIINLFTCGYLIGGDLVPLVFTDKWMSAAQLFRYLCLAQIFVSLNALNGFAHNALGKPRHTLYYHSAAALLVPLSFYYAVQYGFQAVLIPWFTTYVLIALVWTLITIRMIGIGVAEYARTVLHPILGAFIMSVVTLTAQRIMSQIQPDEIILRLMLSILFGLSSYLAYIWIFDESLLRSLSIMLRKKITA
jgi:O-antigen/teichoic acid export membrane protein